MAARANTVMAHTFLDEHATLHDLVTDKQKVQQWMAGLDVKHERRIAAAMKIGDKDLIEKAEAAHKEEREGFKTMLLKYIEAHNENVAKQEAALAAGEKMPVDSGKKIASDMKSSSSFSPKTTVSDKARINSLIEKVNRISGELIAMCEKEAYPPVLPYEEDDEEVSKISAELKGTRIGSNIVNILDFKLPEKQQQKAYGASQMAEEEDEEEVRELTP